MRGLGHPEHPSADTIDFVCQLKVSFRPSVRHRLLDLGGRGLRLLIDNQLCQLGQRSISRYLFVQGLLKKRPSPAETHRFRATASPDSHRFASYMEFPTGTGYSNPSVERNSTPSTTSAKKPTRPHSIMSTVLPDGLLDGRSSLKL